MFESCFLRVTLFVVVNTGGGAGIIVLLLLKSKSFDSQFELIQRGSLKKKKPSNGHDLKNRKSEVGET